MVLLQLPLPANGAAGDDARAPLALEAPMPVRRTGPVSPRSCVELVGLRDRR
jgi:hypothetical protein